MIPYDLQIAWVPLCECPLVITSRLEMDFAGMNHVRTAIHLDAKSIISMSSITTYYIEKKRTSMIIGSSPQKERMSCYNVFDTRVSQTGELTKFHPMQTRTNPFKDHKKMPSCLTQIPSKTPTHHAHVPNSDLQPMPQKSSPEPHMPSWLQQGPKSAPAHVQPSPHQP